MADSDRRSLFLHTEQAISEAAHHLDKMERAARASRRIPRLMGLVDGIAFRTNLLVLSLAVERAESSREHAISASPRSP